MKICINIKKSEDALIVCSSLSKFMTLVKEDESPSVFLTDDPKERRDGAINILISEYKNLSEFKNNYELNGFDHYIIYTSRQFLSERLEKALIRQFKIKSSAAPETEITGTKAILHFDEPKEINGIHVPIFREFTITSSKDRSIMATKLEEFMAEIEPALGYLSQTSVRYALEIQEELLMNAIWDANPKHAHKPRTEVIHLEQEETVKLEWAFNGKDMAISVRDPFGNLNSNIMERYVNFIFKTGRPLDHTLSERKVNAGLGMYMIMQRANLLSVFVNQGRITDVGVVILLSDSKSHKSGTPKAIDIINIK